MKKYGSFLFVLAFILLVFNFITNQVGAVEVAAIQVGSASSVPGCTLPGQPYSTTTGQSCGVVACAAGELFNSVTGMRCGAGMVTSLVPGTSVNTASICSRSFNSLLQVGSRGNDVIVLQQILKDAGLLSGNVDGVYGPMTEAARQNYNRQCSITSTATATRVTAASTTAGDSLPSCPGGYAQTLDTSNVESIAKSIAGGYLESKGYSSKYQSINAGIDGQYVYGNSSYGYTDSCSDGVRMDFNADLKGTDRGGNACLVSIPSIACMRGLTGSANPTTTTTTNPTTNTNVPTVVADGVVSGYSVHHVSNSDLRPFGSGKVKADAGAVVTTNPYRFSLDPGAHTITAAPLDGYSVLGYTIGNANANVTPGSTAAVNVTSNGSISLWWHYAAISPTEVAKGSVSGYSVHRVSASDLRPFGSGKVKVDGGAFVTTNPYNFSLTPGSHTITAAAPSDGFTVLGYTIGNAGGSVTPGSTATVNVTSNGSVDLWWHFASTEAPVTTTTTAPATKGTLQGHFVEDVNGNGQFDSGDKYIRDAADAACNTSEARESGFFIDYKGPSAGSAYLNKCDPSGTLYQVSVTPGSYTFTTHIPAGWTMVKDEAKTTKSTVSVPSGGTAEGPWVFVKRNVTTSTTTGGYGTIQGYSVHHVSNSDLRAFPAGSVTVNVDGGSAGSTSTNPYSLSVTAGTHTVSVNPPSGWEWATTGYTMCTGGFCHNGAVTKNSSVQVNVTAGSTTDLWWHFGDASAMAVVAKDSQKASVWGSVKSWFGF